MRVVVLSHSSAAENLGGAERSLLEFIDGWRARDPTLEVLVVARRPEGLLQPELQRRHIPCITLTYQAWVLPQRIVEPEDVFRTAREDFSAVRAIARVIEEFRADVVITNTIVVPWAAVAAKIVGRPHVWFAHEYGDDHEFQLTVDQTFEDIGTMSDLVVSSSRQLREYLTKWIDPVKIDVLYPEFELAAIDRRREEKPAEWRNPFTEAAQLRIVCVGRIASSKGQARIVEAIARLRDEGLRIEAAFVGSASPENFAAITAQIARLGVEDRVALTGETSNPFVYLAASDISVVASDSEGFGRVTVESMAVGLPVVATRTGATVELIEDGVTGMLVKPGDVAALAVAIRSYALRPEVVAEHGRAGRARVVTELSRRHPRDVIVKRIEEVVAAGSSPLVTLPHLMLSWMELPTITLRYLGEKGITVDPRNMRVWKLGSLVTRAAKIFRKGGAV